MNILKVAVSCAIVVASFGAMAQNGAPVKLTKYSTYTESDWGAELTLKADGKASLKHSGMTDAGKMKTSVLQGTWTQEGNILTTKFGTGKKAFTQVYQIKESNSTSSWDCKAVYGLSPVEKGSTPNEIGSEHLWVDSLMKDKGPCGK